MSKHHNQNKHSQQQKNEVVVSTQEDPKPPTSPHQAAASAVAEVEEYEARDAVPGQYQSSEAKEVVSAERVKTYGSAEPKAPVEAKIAVPKPDRVVVLKDQAEYNKMVKIRPRKSVARFRVGKDWYQITAGQDTLVPKHIATLLEQRGYL